MTEQVPRDLVQEITSILIKHSHPTPTDWHSKVNPDVYTQSDEGIRRFLINQFWRNALGKVDLYTENNTMGERFCLVEDGSIDDWLRLFDTQVAPSIIKYRVEFPTH